MAPMTRLACAPCGREWYVRRVTRGNASCRRCGFVWCAHDLHALPPPDEPRQRPLHLLPHAPVLRLRATVRAEARRRLSVRNLRPARAESGRREVVMSGQRRTKVYQNGRVSA
jgi:hypothetical protein